MKTDYDFNASAKYVATTPENVLMRLAYEMNTRWPIFAQSIQAMELAGLPGEQVDDLMEGLFIVWHATVKKGALALPELTIQDLEQNVQRLSEFLEYHRGETDLKERRALQFIQHPQLEAFMAFRLRAIYDLGQDLSQVGSMYIAMMKCFDDAITAAQG